MMITTRKMTMRWRTTTTRMIKLLKAISSLEKIEIWGFREVIRVSALMMTTTTRRTMVMTSTMMISSRTR